MLFNGYLLHFYNIYIRTQKHCRTRRVSACKRLSGTVSFTFYNFVLVCKRKMLLIGELEGNNSCSSIVRIK